MFLPLYLLVMDWVSPLKLSYRIESLKIWEHLMYVLPWISVVTMGYRVPLDVCFGDQLVVSAHEPMHRGWHTFSSWLSGRNFGALFEVLCVGLSIMNLKLFDAYRIINSWIVVVTLEYLGNIRVGLYISYGVILVRTLGLFVTLIGIAR